MIKTITWFDDKIRIIDQTKLPHVIEYLDCFDYIMMGEAIRELKVRGAPAIGVAAAMAIALHSLKLNTQNFDEFENELLIASDYLKSMRPTAVNLFWATDRMMNVIHSNKSSNVEDLKVLLVNESKLIAKEDENMCRAIGRYGAELVPQNANILTHCNAGALATYDYGTALGIIRYAHETGKNIHVYVDETRPLLQGARLTAWELDQEKIPFTLITDSMSGHFIHTGKVDLIITGADRIARNGDSANKIGTYTLAVLAKENNIPFYIAAPSSTIDLKIDSGEEIVIEERKHEEVTNILGQRIAPEGINVANPAFDVTPNRYISGIITENGVIRPPFNLND